MCTEHDFGRDQAGDRLYMVECDDCGHLMLFDLSGEADLTRTDLEIANSWYKALVTGRASQGALVPVPA